jgi:hypothetical protein
LKKFFVLFSSQAFSIFGSSVVGFALAWYLAKETGSAAVLICAIAGFFFSDLMTLENQKMEEKPATQIKN